MSFNVGDLIVFNSSSSFHRMHYIFGIITSITKAGTVKFQRFGRHVIELENNPAYSKNRVMPNFDVVEGVGTLLKKRGKEVSNDYFRYEKLDVILELYKQTIVYDEDNCY